MRKSYYNKTLWKGELLPTTRPLTNFSWWGGAKTKAQPYQFITALGTRLPAAAQAVTSRFSSKQSKLFLTTSCLSTFLHFICNTPWYLLCLWHPATSDRQVQYAVTDTLHNTKMRNYLFYVNNFFLSLKNISAGTLFLAVWITSLAYHWSKTFTDLFLLIRVLQLLFYDHLHVLLYSAILLTPVGIC